MNPKDMNNSAPTNLPNAYGSCSSTLHPCIQPVGNMSAQNGKVDVNPNMLLAQPSNVGMTSTMNGNLIKLEPVFDNRSPFDFGTHVNLFESCSAVGDTPISSFSSVESNTQHHCDALLDADSPWIRQTFGFDLTADFSNNPGVSIALLRTCSKARSCMLEIWANRSFLHYCFRYTRELL